MHEPLSIFIPFYDFGDPVPLAGIARCCNIFFNVGACLANSAILKKYFRFAVLDKVENILFTKRIIECLIMMDR
jgi:hypothetical protein